jgi:hypothetical protein
MPRFEWISRAAFCAVAVATAVGCADRERAMAMPSIYLHQDSVAIGGPIEITVSFHIPRDVPPFAENHRVLLRLLFDDGNVMGSYDHDPPIPTRRWEAGRTITYTRRIFAPDVPYVGDVPVVVGLYSTAGKRLVLSATHKGDRMYEVGTLRLNAQRTLLALGGGWHRPESPAHEPGWRWTQSAATMTFHNPRRDAMLHLRLDGSPDRFDTPQQVSLLIGDRVVHSFHVSSTSVTDHAVPLRAGDFGADREATLTIKVDKTFVPARMGQGSDTRELGVRVYNVFLELQSSS